MIGYMHTSIKGFTVTVKKAVVFGERSISPLFSVYTVKYEKPGFHNSQ